MISALYQLHLVKAETARAIIPKEIKLVEAFGYTLGGFFLANYQDSPAGGFDELVIIAGTVWNSPTSCAWAAKVLVNSDEACDHGRKDVGLPSQVARFSKRITAIEAKPKAKYSGILDTIGLGSHLFSPKDSMDVQVTEVSTAPDLCDINVSTTVPVLNKWTGPAIKMSLPSFSGRTEYNPNLLKYSCHMECRIRAVWPATVSGRKTDEKQSLRVEQQGQAGESKEKPSDNNGENLCLSVMFSKPIFALEFNCLKMKVEAPVVVSSFPRSALQAS
ncbi:hypothetical protein ACFE04_025316 [Oxalis oulophora]